MDMLLYKKIIDEVADKNLYARVWLDFYGEPLLLRYQLYYMIVYAKNKGLQNICLNTNATLMNHEMTEMLLDSGIDFISFDVYGFSKEVLEKISVGANRDVIYDNVEYFLRRKKERNLSSMVAEVKVLELEENKEEVNQIIQYWRKKGAWTTVRRAITGGGTTECSIKHEVPAERIACGYSVGLCAITWDGHVATCALDADASTIYGDVNTESIENIWQRRNKELTEKHLAHKFEELPEVCKRCTDWTIIGEERYDENGNVVKKSYESGDKMIEGH
jgi:radical SAM protein with 4Fe4S-binding SPASM domain